MSVLFWLFGLGAGAIAFPFLFHLIRRTPKGQTQFSSLMFLKPSPPTLTRRSRLENLLLLLLRMAVIVLIAAAFMRPFFRGNDSLSLDQVSSRRIAILVDTSASMQREGVWSKVRNEVDAVLEEVEAGDQVGLFTFDRSVETRVAFDDETVVAGQQEGRLNLVKDRIREEMEELQPGWDRSNLGSALVQAADQLSVWRDSQRTRDAMAGLKLQIIVVSDLQKGSQTDALQSYQWPADVFVDFRLLVPENSTNATVQVLDPVPESDDPDARRVRVRNFEDSNEEQFFVKWIDRSRRESEHPVPFHVPHGTSRVLALDEQESRDGIEFFLTGDQHAFDNSFYVVPPQVQQVRLAYLGQEDANDPDQMLFYLSRALADNASRTVEIRQLGPEEKLTRQPDGSDPETSLVIVTSEIGNSRRQELESFMNEGGAVLLVLTDPGMADSLKELSLANPAEQPENNSSTRYAMLGNIDFRHPLFDVFASPQFNDFTGIRFWKYLAVEFPDSDRVDLIASFDNHGPAIWQVDRDGGGPVFAMACGWRPDDSQLALSTKFVPLMNGFLKIALDRPDFKRSYLVHDAIEFGAAEPTDVRSIVKPDNSVVAISPETTRFLDTDLPGIYRLTGGNEEYTFAVNLDRAESETEPIPISQLEMLDLNVGRQQTASTEMEMLRQKRDQELESSQKLWKWLIVSALLLLITESWLAGKTSLQQARGESAGEPQPAAGGAA